MPPRRRNRVPPTVEESVNVVGGQENPPQTNPAQALLDMLIGAAQTRNVQAPVVQPPATPLANFKDFKAVGPPEFKGTTDPIEAQSWVKEMEKAFVIARVTDEQKTAFATYLLKGEANYWWEANQARAGDGVVTWARFKELFFENYFPKSMQARMEIRFLELKQEGMSVAEYAAKFNELARFAPHQVDTEERKAQRFEQGLRPALYAKIAVLHLVTFSDVLDRAIIAEASGEAISKYNQEQKRKWNEESGKDGGKGGNNKRRWNGSNKNSGSVQKEAQVKMEPCGKCGKIHRGECLKGQFRCYRCGQEGHTVPNCPNPKKNYGCFGCGDMNHQMKDCPKKGYLEGTGNKNNNKPFQIGGPVQVPRPTARTFNMTVLDTVAAKGLAPGTILNR